MSDIRAFAFEGGLAITPSNTANDPAGPFAALWIGTAGNATIVDSRGNVTTYTNLPAGFLLPLQCVRVNSTGLTAGSIVGLRANPVGGP
jgi:hypothetical protein